MNDDAVNGTPLGAHKLRALRESYDYFPATLMRADREASPEQIIAWPGIVTLAPRYPDPMRWKSGQARPGHSSIAVDRFHAGLFASDADDQLLHGLASVQFWGHAETRGNPNVMRGVRRARWLTDGKMPQTPQPIGDILEALREARGHVVEGNLDKALRATLRIRELGIPFASKVVAAMDPSKAAIYDSVIARYLQTSRYPEHDGLQMEVKHTYSGAQIVKRAEIYARWCGYCSSKASELNAGGSQWRDWDGTLHNWRAIDVEHAIFALGRQRQTGPSSTYI